MQTLKLKDGQSALVVVAHPDDETIWLGGTIARYPKVRWTIFSLCRASDADRQPKFLKVCRLYKAQAFITDLEDDDKLTIQQTIPQIKKLLLATLPSKKFTYLFTHGANGEYGHDRHRGVHLAVQELLQTQRLTIEAGFYFNYRKKPGKFLNKKGEPIFPMQAKSNSDYQLKLTAAELASKKKIVAEMHGYDPAGIDVNLCPNPEAFLSIKLPQKTSKPRKLKN